MREHVKHRNKHYKGQLMNIIDILAKIAKGESLTDAEKKFAAEYKEPEGGEGRIPKERLDQEISKRKAAEDQVAQLTSKVDELTGKVEELTTSGMSEADKAKAEAAKQLKTLQAQVEKLTKERDEAAKKAADMEFSGGVRDLAAKHNFVDAEYLGYKLQAAGIKLDDAAGVAAFMKGLEKDSPNMFKSSAKPGGGTSTDGNGDAGRNNAQMRLDELGKKTELSSREVAEVIELQAQIKAGDASNGGAAAANNGGANNN